MEQSKDEKLGTEKLGKLIVSMALPAVAAQLINVLYNIVDRIYIGHIAGHGDMALTGGGGHIPDHYYYFGVQCIRRNGRGTDCFYSFGKERL